MIQELNKHKNEIKNSYELAQITEKDTRYEKEIRINKQLTIVIEKAIDTEIPEIILSFSEDSFNFSGYHTDLEHKKPEIYEFFEYLFGDMFWYCEKTDNINVYYWIGN